MQNNVFMGIPLGSHINSNASSDFSCLVFIGILVSENLNSLRGLLSTKTDLVLIGVPVSEVPKALRDFSKKSAIILSATSLPQASLGMNG